MKSNFHTHHYLCKHASGEAEDYVLEAIKHGFIELGISDHAPMDKYNLGLRMYDDEFPQYINDILEAKKKYKDQLTIYTGLEIEHFYNEDEYYQFFEPYIDYFILGQHFVYTDDHNSIGQDCFEFKTKEEIQNYANIVCDGMRTKRYAILAHPDVFMNGYVKFDDTAKAVSHQICSVAAETNTILEFNGNGYRRKKIEANQGLIPPYPNPDFWKIAEQYPIRTILSSDCHNPKQLYDTYLQEVEAEFRKLSLKKVTYFNEF